MPSPSSRPSDPAQDEHGGGSNTGAIAGGVVGGIVAVLLVLVLLWWFRRRSQRARGPQQTQTGESEDFRKPELRAEQSMQRHELATTTRSELDGAGSKGPAQLP